jgi:hypothetical protein
MESVIADFIAVDIEDLPAFRAQCIADFTARCQRRGYVVEEGTATTQDIVMGAVNDQPEQLVIRVHLNVSAA